MSPLKEVLSPSLQNHIQRLGFFGSLAVASLILFLHFPFEGYDIDHYVTTRYGFGPCPSHTEEDIRNMTPEQTHQAVKDLQRCGNSTEKRTLPFTEWKSRAPVIDWFGSVVHTIAALVFALSLGGIWLWVFRTQDDG